MGRRSSKMKKKEIVKTITIVVCLILFSILTSVLYMAEEPWQTVLVWSDIKAGKEDAVKKALDKGLDPNSLAPTGYPLLQTAVANDNVEIVKLLLKYGADPKRYGCEWLVDTAVRNNNYELVKLLVHAGAVVKRPSYFCCIWDDPLVDAVGKQNLEIVRFLLANGADPNAAGLSLTTALQTAAQTGNIDIMKLLIESGAIIDQRNGYGRTALMLACAEGQLVSVEFLLSQGADPSLATPYGDTALSVAQKSTNPSKDKIIDALLARKK